MIKSLGLKIIPRSFNASKPAFYRFRNTFLVKNKKYAHSFSTSAYTLNLLAPKHLWGQYKILLEKYPITTKALTSGFIAAFGDILCQLVIESKDFSMQRFIIFTSIGGFFAGPALHFWYRALAKHVQGTGIKSLVTRVAADQLIFAPSFLASFFALMGFIQGSANEIPSRIKKDLMPTLVANWSVWVPVQFINFRLIPGNLQVLFANFIGLLWNAYLSYVSHN